MKNNLIILFAAFMIISCQQSMWIDKEPNIDASTFRTYSWNSLQNYNEASYYNLNEIDSVLKREVDKVLDKKGYQKSKNETADFFISYHIYIKENYYEEKYCPTGFYGANGFSPDLSAWPNCLVEEQTIVYDSGTLVLDIVDIRTGQLIWRGSSFQVIDKPIFAAEMFGKKVRKLLKEFAAPM